jgi:hypothetical protein
MKEMKEDRVFETLSSFFYVGRGGEKIFKKIFFKKN